MSRAPDNIAPGSTAVVSVKDLVRRYKLPREGLFRPAPILRALAGVSFTIERGQSFGVVGESGCGKSTLARIVAALDRPDGGSVEILGRDLAALPAAEGKRLRAHFQIVFQDPYGSLDPRHKVTRIVGEPLSTIRPALSRANRQQAIREAVLAVGLRDSDLDKYPHEFSGGQRQRIAIARAIVTKPDLIIADEPVSALDVSVQAQILNLMKDLQEDFGLTYMFISHDLSVVEFICDHVAVMYAGRIVEQAATHQLFDAPMHPYTRLLLDAVPRIGGAGETQVFGDGRRPDEIELSLPLREVAPNHFAAI